MTGAFSTAKGASTRPVVAEQAANNIREASTRLGTLYRGLSAPGVLGRETLKDCLPNPEASLDAIHSASSVLECRIGVEALLRFSLTAGGDYAKSELLPLRHWEFLAEQAVRVVDAAEQAFALDLPDASAQFFAHAMEVLERLALEVGRHKSPPKPGGPPRKSSIQH